MTKRLSYSATPVQRFERFHQPIPFSGCWIWMGALSSDGYGSFYVDGRSIAAHKFSYEQLHGPVAPLIELDHLCRVRCCVNPAHVEPVTHKVNMLRGEGFASLNAAKTNCAAGHSFDADNTYWLNGRRGCRACNREAVRRYKQRASV